MAEQQGGVAPATAALASLLVHFGEGRGNEATWRLGVNAQLPVADPDWDAKHDALLLDVLQQVGALGGLPAGLRGCGGATVTTSFSGAQQHW